MNFIDTDVARAFEAIEITSVSGGGAKLALEDLTFNLGAADASLRFDLDTFRTTNTVTFAGAFTGAGGGKGMRIYGSLASGVATIGTPFVGAPAWSFEGASTISTSAQLTITDAAIIAPGTGITVRDTAMFTATDAEFTDAFFTVQGTATAAFSNCDFKATGTSTSALVSVTSTGVPVTVSSCRFNGAPNVKAKGARVSTTASITGSQFESLACGLDTGATSVVTDTGNTFVSCTKDRCTF